MGHVTYNIILVCIIHKLRICIIYITKYMYKNSMDELVPLLVSIIISVKVATPVSVR